MQWTCVLLTKTGGHFQQSQRERQLVLFRQLGDRELFTATVGEAAQQMAVHARKRVGYAARIATGIARLAKIHTRIVSDHMGGGSASFIIVIGIYKVGSNLHVVCSKCP